MSESNFSNQVLSNEHLPHISDLEFQPLSDKYASTNRLIIFLLTSFLMLGLIVTYHQPLKELPTELYSALRIIMACVAGLGILIGFYRFHADRYKAYALRELDLSFRSGLIFRKTVTQPVTRIQHVELKRGPIDRHLGLASLQVFSAGGAHHTFQIPGLPLEKAQQIRQFLLQHKDVSTHG